MGVEVDLEIGAGLGVGVGVLLLGAAEGLAGSEVVEGSVEHGLEAMFCGQEALEGGAAVCASGLVGIVDVGGGAKGSGDEQAGGDLAGEVDGLLIVEGMGVGVVVCGGGGGDGGVWVVVSGLMEEVVVLAGVGAEVGFIHEGEGGVGGLEASEAPGGGDDAFGEAELDGVLGCEGFEDGVAEGVEELGGLAGVEEVCGEGGVGEGVLAGAALALVGAWAGGFGGVLAVGGAATVGRWIGGHGVPSFLSGGRFSRDRSYLSPREA
jgi:hypothetical protein